MSKFPSAKTLSDEFNRKYAERFEALFMEIGYAFIGQRSQVCLEEPGEKKRRFKLFHSWSNWGIDLWYGTSFFIPCEPTPAPSEDDFAGYRADTGDKDTVITFTPRYENPKNYGQVGFQIKIFDDLDLFPSFNQTYWKYDNFDQTEKLLVQIRDALL
jgi:hypothetical protein